MNAIELTKRDQKIDFLVRKAKILVVDDQKSHRLLLKTLLARVGHEVLLAESAEEAFECLGLENPEQKGHGIELVLMDLQMQGVNGIEACARIKLEPHLKNIPLVIVTTETVEKYISTVMQCGSAGFIRKPICEAELLANVALVLNWVDETQKGQRITEALTCSNKRLNEFAAIASHDLMEPLRKITCFGGLLLDKYNEVLGDEGQDYLARMINAAERMQKYTSNLLNYAHVRDVEPAFSRIDLRRVAQEGVEDLFARIEEDGGTINFKYLPTIVVSKFMKQELFPNLP
ncbi:MAG: response regulator, partial [Nitrospinae bacterium]|nr:response regulator [Nitrospinota bacterium]